MIKREQIGAHLNAALVACVKGDLAECEKQTSEAMALMRAHAIYSCGFSGCHKARTPYSMFCKYHQPGASHDADRKN